MSKFRKKWLYVGLIILALIGSARLYYRLTDDFRLGNMIYPLPFQATWQVPTLSSEEYQTLAHIFDQTFYYLDKGAQSYAFVSEDQQYILKFFKFKHLKPHFLVDLLPSIPPFKDFKQNCMERKKRKLLSVFNGYDLAYRENRQAAGLLYVHLQPTHDLKWQVTIVDKIGLRRQIALDDVVFLLQKKGETLRSRLNRLLKQQNVQEAKQALSSILTMYMAEYQKGLFDHDHGVLHNTGFVGDHPFHLDLGKLNKDERIQQVDVYKKDLEHIIWKMDRWVQTNYPQYYQEISHFLSQQYASWIGERLDIQALDPQRFKRRR